ncbi:Efg1p [Sporobolomyces salmoneus]|uniref:Efg1p n=1 Tax=Sporobolomyces salmoneus TaxID=183962 RepID=UPI003178105C
MSESQARGRGRGRGGSSRGSSRGGGATSSSSSGGIPSGSVSKIKAQLRQTKRLLSKPDLNPDVKITSERRLAALEMELVKAEKGLLEKKMVSKYRGVKFFERQKVLRRIKQAKKQLESDPSAETTKEQLKSARLDLYYILRYPKTEKYLALYPENSYIPYSSSPPSAPNSSAITPSDPSTSKAAAKPKDKALESERKRWELRTEILRKVESGEWAEESEGGDLGIEGEEDEALESVRVEEKRGRDDERGQEVEEDSSNSAKKRKVDSTAGEPTSTSLTAEVTTEEGKDTETVAEVEGDRDGEPKKLNRKQKKAFRRAQEAAGIVPPSTEAPTPQKTTTEAKKETKEVMTKKGGKEVGKNSKEATNGGNSKAEKLAAEDDFFA